MSKFPGEIDSDAEIPSVIDGATEISGEHLNAQKEAIIAVEKTLGINPQGTVASVADRLDVSINPDGTLNATAITSAWLLSAPIMNSNVSAAAAIDESKLNLDVPTANLQDQISSIAVDLGVIQENFYPDVARLASHVAGTADKHLAQHIVVSPAIASGVNAQSAIQNTYNQLSAHVSNPAGAHDADSISYSPSTGSLLTATSVGGALDEIDSSFINRVNRHLDTAHSNGISSDGYSYLGGQGSVNSASLAGVPFLPLGGQQRIKIGGINHATVISKGANVAALGASASQMLVDYSDGYSLYTVSVIGLNSSPYPAGSENRLRGVVAKINEAFRTAGALVTAFQFENELVLQHNTPDGYIAVRSSPGSSAVSALGFADIEGQRSFPISHFVSVTDGIPIDGWAPLSSGSATFATSSLSLNISSAVDVGSLLHITNHTGLGSGTYQIVSISGTNATLNRPIPAGSFSYRVFPDSIGIGSVSSGTTYDVFVDQNGIPSAVSRADISISQISGIRISRCNLPAGTYSISTSGSGSTCTVRINSGSFSGNPVSIPHGYLGTITVDAPRGLGSVVLDIVSLAPSSPATDTFVANYSLENDNLQHVFSYWSNGSSVEYPVDSRNLGLVNSDALGSDVFKHTLAQFPSNRMNGIIACDTVNVSGATVQVPNIKVLIGGKVSQVYSTEIDFFSTGIAADIYNLYVDLSSSLRLALESGSGHSLHNIVSRGEVPIARLAYNGSSVSAIDLRLFSLPSLPIDGLIVGGPAGTYHCASLDGALLVADAAGSKKIKLQSDQSTSLDLTIPANLTVTGSVSITCRTLSLLSGSSIDVDAITTTASILTDVGISATDSGKIIAHSISTGSVELSNYSSLGFLNATITSSAVSDTPALTLSGSGNSVFGIGPGATFSLLSGRTISFDSASDTLFSEFSAVFSSAAFDWVSFYGSCTNLTFDRFSAYKSGLVTPSEIISHNVFKVDSAANLSSISISNGAFEECGRIFRNDNSLGSVSINSCSASNFGGIFYQAAGASAAGCTVSDFYGYRIGSNLIDLASASSVVMSNSVFSETFGAAPAEVRIFSSSGSAPGIAANISKCVFSGISFLSYLVYAPSGSSASLNLSNCSFSSVTSIVSQAIRSTDAGNLISWASTNSLHLSDCVMTSCSFKIASGRNIELTGNNIQLATTANKLELFNISSPLTVATDPAYNRPLATLANNRIQVYSGRSRMHIGSSTLSGNYITADEFVFAHGVGGLIPPNSAGYVVDGNSFESTDGYFTPISFSFYPGYSVSNNRFYGSATGTLIKLGTTSSGYGFLKFNNNSCTYAPISVASSIIEVSDSSSSGISYVINDNSLQVSNIDGYSPGVGNAIKMLPNNVVCYQNSIISSGILGTLFSGVGSQTGCRIVGNSIIGGAVSVEDLSDDNVFESNYGVVNEYAISPFSAQTLNWTINADGLQASDDGDVVWIPINSSTGQLLEVSADFDFSTSGLQVQLSVYTINSSTGALVQVATSSFTSSVIGYASSAVSLLTPQNIGLAKTAALRITKVGAGGTVKLRNIRAKIIP